MSCLGTTCSVPAVAATVSGRMRMRKTKRKIIPSLFNTFKFLSCSHFSSTIYLSLSSQTEGREDSLPSSCLEHQITHPVSLFLGQTCIIFSLCISERSPCSFSVSRVHGMEPCRPHTEEIRFSFGQILFFKAGFSGNTDMITYRRLTTVGQ